jgi:hypothetical protein
MLCIALVAFKIARAPSTEQALGVATVTNRGIAAVITARV